VPFFLASRNPGPDTATLDGAVELKVR